MGPSRREVHHDLIALRHQIVHGEMKVRKGGEGCCRQLTRACHT
jgi:hypothetical protein